MRIFEKISRRLAITLAGVMACSSFAMAPAITVRAEEAAKTEKEIIAELETKANAELKNEADYVDETLKINEVEGFYKVYKIRSDIEGKMKISILAKEEVKDMEAAFWKKGDEKYISLEETVTMEKGKTKENEFDVKEGDYYLLISNNDTNAEAKYQIKAAIKTTGKESKIRNAESPAKKTAKVTIKKVKKVDGYEIRLSTSKDFDKNVKTKSVKAKKIEFKDKKGTIEKNGLKSGKKYYVQVRTYIKKNGVKYYSEWSKSKKIAKVK